MARQRRSSEFCSGVVLVFVAALFVPPQRMYSAGQDDNKVEVLYQTAIAELGYNSKITDDAAQALKNFIAQGVKAHPDVDISESQRAIKKFAGAMLEHAQSDTKASTPTRIIDAESFKSAKASVCPLYPFC